MKIIECTKPVTHCPNCGKVVSKDILADWENDYFTCFIAKELDNNNKVRCYNVICLNDGE